VSTFILGRLVNADRPAWAQVLDKDPTATKHWIEALAAVIPAEALAAYTAMISFFTMEGEDEASASLTDESWVRGLTLAILLAIPLVYAAGSGNRLGGKHVVRWLVAMIAFAAWLWLLPLSAWNLFPWDPISSLAAHIRAATGIVGALVIVSGAGVLFRRWPLP
jgi:hypothetical protein